VEVANRGKQRLGDTHALPVAAAPQEQHVPAHLPAPAAALAAFPALQVLPLADPTQPDAQGLAQGPAAAPVSQLVHVPPAAAATSPQVLLPEAHRLLVVAQLHAPLPYFVPRSIWLPQLAAGPLYAQRLHGLQQPQAPLFLV
jgi:hypothetical protein